MILLFRKTAQAPCSLTIAIKACHTIEEIKLILPCLFYLILLRSFIQSVRKTKITVLKEHKSYEMDTNYTIIWLYKQKGFHFK